MSQYFQEYITVGAFAAVGVLLVLAILGVASVIRPSNPTPAKKLTYECGVDPVGSGWSQTYVRYYIFGLLFVILLATYLTYLIYSDRKQNGGAKADNEDDDDLPVPSKSVWLDLLMVAGGILAVVGGGELLVDNAIVLAKTFNVSDEVIGLTLVSVGTSLPELATSVMAAIRKHSDIALGNVLGSNVYNILGIAGITALIKPIPVTDHMVQIDIPVMIGVSLILFFLAVVVKRFGKRVGYAFLAAYIGYIYLLVA